MVQIQRINIGSAPNDGTGDPTRQAWDKQNRNNAALAAGLDAVAVARGAVTTTRYAAVGIPANTHVVDVGNGQCAVADPSNLAHCGKLIGLVQAAVSAGALATIVVFGPVSGVSGAFQAGNPLFIAANGGLTATAPLQGWRQQTGTATSGSDIAYAPGLAYVLPASASQLVTPTPDFYAVLGQKAGFDLTDAQFLAAPGPAGRPTAVQVIAALPSFTLPDFATAQAAVLAASINLIAIRRNAAGGLRGMARYRRVDAAPGHGLKFRSADRYTSTGGYDLVNGGWWEIAEAEVTLYMAGAAGDGVASDVAALTTLLDYASGTEAAPFGRTVRVSSARYLIDGIATFRCFGVKTLCDTGAVLVRKKGTFATLACQGDYNEFQCLAADWLWSQNTDETWPNIPARRAVLYVTGNFNRFVDLRLRNAPGNFVQLDGMQRFGVRYDGVGSPFRVAYGQSYCATGNQFIRPNFESAYFGGIIQYWARDTYVESPHIWYTGAEALTFDTYTTGCHVTNVDFFTNIIPGLGGGVGAIGADSGTYNRVIGGRIRGTGYIGGNTAGVMLLGYENSTIGNWFVGILFQDCAGPAFFLWCQQAHSDTIAGTSGANTVPANNVIAACGFFNCGNNADYRAALAAENNNTPPPNNIAVYIKSAVGNYAFGNVIANDNRMNGHVVLDAPGASWVNDPANPNSTARPDWQTGNATRDGNLVVRGAANVNTLVFANLGADPPVANGTLAFVNGHFRKCANGAWSDV